MRYLLCLLLMACVTEPPVTGVVRITHDQLTPLSIHDRVVHRAGWVEPASLPDHQELEATVTLPAQAEVTQVMVSAYRETGHELVTGGLWAVGQDAVFGFTHQGTGWRLDPGVRVNQLVAQQYRLHVVLGAYHDGVVSHARFAYAEVHYRRR